jgi:MFS family permease
MFTHFFNRVQRFFALPPDATVDADIARHYPRNFLVNGVDMVFWLFGSSFVSVSAILPVFASRLTDSAIVIGLIPALTDAGWFLPQLFLAPYVERLARKKPIVIWLGAVERLPYFVLPVMALWLPSLPRTAAVTVFMALMAWKALGSGIVATPWQELMAKIIPVARRGRFFGTAHFVGQLLGVGGSAIAAWLLATLPYPQNFAWCFGVGSVGIGGSLAFLAFAREPARAPEPRLMRPQQPYLTRLTSILRRDANFRTYLLSRWLAYFGGMANGFLAVYAVKHYHLPDAAAAVYTGLLYGAGVAGYAIWGPLGDRWGHKRVMELANSVWLAALALAFLSPAAWGFNVVFALVGFANAGGVLSDLNIAMEFGPEAERPTYIGLARTVTGPAVFVAPVLGGWIAQTWNYPALFAVSLLFALAGLALLHWRVREPRRARTETKV